MSVSSNRAYPRKGILRRLIPPPSEAVVAQIECPTWPVTARALHVLLAGSEVRTLEFRFEKRLPPLGIGFTIPQPDFGPLVDWRLDQPSVIGVLFDRSQGSEPSPSRSAQRGFRSWGPSDAALRRLLASLLPMLLPPPRSGEDVDQHFAMKFPHPLYAFQRDGVEFLLNRPEGALLADDMGLGKTVQAIVALRQMFRRGNARRALVVAPAAVVTTWLRHFKSWAPELRVASMQMSKFERARLWHELSERLFHVVVVSYDTYRNDVQNGAPVPVVDVLIADEVQKVKNPTASRSQVLMRQQAKVRWGLSGTPLENNVDEFRQILRICAPGSVGSVTSATALKATADRLMLRRKKEAVLSQLPSLVSNIEYLTLTDTQRREYDNRREVAQDQLRRGERSYTRVRAHVQELKQICNSVNGESIKLQWLQEYMQAVDARNEKLLVFAYYRRAISEIEQELRKYHPLCFTGSTPGQERTRIVDAFQQKPHNRVMVLQLIAGGTGITLHAANRVVRFDSWWNPAVQNQATARAHRIGQEKTVFETTLVCVDTIEERIQQLLMEKRKLFDDVVNDLSVSGLERTLSMEEMYGLFDL